MEMRYQDTGIIKALECCASETTALTCGDCPLFDLRRPDCYRVRAKNALDLINRQKSEIERLRGWENLLKAESHAPIIKKAKVEAIKEFSERLATTFEEDADYKYHENTMIILRLVRETIYKKAVEMMASYADDDVIEKACDELGVYESKPPHWIPCKQKTGRGTIRTDGYTCSCCGKWCRVKAKTCDGCNSEMEMEAKEDGNNNCND